jgi:DNA-binding MarR family transcriptional regulator
MRKTAAKPPAVTPAVPRPGEGKRGEAGHLGYLLRQAATAHRVRMERALADLGVTPPQFAVMTMLAAYPGASNADLARTSLLTPQTVSVIVANLEKAGTLAREAHAVHGRIQTLALTTAGARLLARCRARVQTVEAHLADGLGEAEEAAVRRWLVRVGRHAEAEADSPQAR